MSNFEKNAVQNAWDIASDPSASEDKWMKAVTLLDGKNPIAKTTPRPPGWIALPWALVVSGASASGAVLLFSLMQLILCTRISEAIGSVAVASNVAVAFGVWFVPCLVFSMLFTYKRLLYDGGYSWKVTHGLLLLGYLATISFWAVDGQPIAPWDAGLLALWNLSCVAMAAIGTKMAEHSYKSLNQTIGAQRLLLPMARNFAVVPILVAGVVITGMTTGFYMPFGQVFILLTGTIAASTYLTVRQLNANRTSTARAISAVLWGPFILSNLMLFPALVATHAWLSVTGPYFINWIDYAGAFGTLALSIGAPITGGYIASKQLQARAALSLERGDQRAALALEETALPPLSTSAEF